MFQKPDPRQSFPKQEEEILEYWKTNKIFEKSVAKNEGKEEYVFYDGPPFATGLPHYGHIIGGTLKDVIPRYQNMRGYYLPRRWGWDCHGLPVENLVEKELGLEDKQALIEFGVDKFNEACRSSVLRYTKEWGKVVERMGRWVDFEDSYKTMSPDYMETIWWVFKSLWDKGLVYKGKKSMHVCPRCVTPLSNFEVGLGYKDVKDFSSTVQFKLKDTAAKQKLFGEGSAFVLGWTTTTWTLPGNIMLAVGEDIDYYILDTKPHHSNDRAKYVIAVDCFHDYARQFPDLTYDSDEKQFLDADEKPVKVEIIKGKKLLGLAYEPLYDVYRDMGYDNLDKCWKVYGADFVDTEAGTGVVHVASGYGEDDMNMAKSMGMPIIQHVGMDGRFIEELGPELKKFNISGAENKTAADKFIADELTKKGYYFSSQKYLHSYPHCWRCETPLLNYATDSWYVNIDKIKKKMIANNQKINWVPDHIKDGRFGKWLEGARDWAISRSRYWGTPLPIWEGDSGSTECLGSIAELRARLPKRFTKITLVRHGQSEGNTIGLRQGIEPGTTLTAVGRKQARAAGKKLKKIHKTEPFDLLLHSPLLRTEETARIILEEMGAKIKMQPHDSIREINFGQHEAKRDIEIKEETKRRAALSPEDHYTDKIGMTGESHHDVTERLQDFIKSTLKEHAGKSLLLVTHSDPIRLLLREINGDSLELLYSNGHYPMGEPKELYFDNETGQLVDLHKHFVDGMEYKHPDTGETMKRIPEVLDCWFESGSMPYAQAHYPFENKERFEATFPANFIAEGLDQTRGWFYTLVVLSSALFDEPAFQNVIVNGIVLAEDGQKMSKSKQNFPDPKIIFDKYGADAMRIYLMNSPAVRADDLRFSEKGVGEVVRSTLLPLWNSYSFLLTYAGIDDWKPRGQVYFVRHGETALNKSDQIQGHMDEPLNDHGRDQVEDLRKITNGLPIEVIVSSDFQRARQTADILNADFDLEIDIHADLREQNFGDHEGQNYHDLIKDCPDKMHPAHFVRKSPPKGETLVAFEKRIFKAYEEIKAKYAGKNVLIVGHGGTFNVITKHQMGIKDWKAYYRDHPRRTNNASLTLFETEEFNPSNKLDRWVMSELHTLIKGMTDGLDNYDLMNSLNPLVRFIDSLTNWYIRRSRRRFWKSENDGDKYEAYQTLYTVLVEICKLLAPFAPFITEAMYRNLTGLESVHLSAWPVVEPQRIDEDLNEEISLARQIVALGHAARARANIKVRQPLGTLEVALPDGSGRSADLAEQIDVIREELNVKEINFLKSVKGKVKIIVKPNGKILGPIYGAAVQDIIREAKAGNYKELKSGNYQVLDYELSPDQVEVAYESLEAGEGHLEVQADRGMVVILDTKISPELMREGYARDIVRSIQNLRKEADLKVSDRIKVGLSTDDPEVQKAITEYQDYIMKETLATEISPDKLNSDWEAVVKLGEHGAVATIERA